MAFGVQPAQSLRDEYVWGGLGHFKRPGAGKFVPAASVPFPKFLHPSGVEVGVVGELGVARGGGNGGVGVVVGVVAVVVMVRARANMN